MTSIRVLVVDDAVVMRRIICQVLEEDPELEIAGWAANGRLALARIPQVNPDCVTLDVEMPEMDGIATLRELRKTYPRLPVIMFSTETKQGAVRTIEALSLGATDYVCKPANVGSVGESIARLQQELVPRIKAHCRKPGETAAVLPVRTTKTRPIPGSRRSRSILCIASSTGGPSALSSIFQRLPFALPVPVVIVQHMPPVFTRLLAERLDTLGPSRVSEAREGDVLEAGHVYLAPGGRHMELTRHASGSSILLTDTPPENSCRPAADVLFRSVADIYGASALGLVLTGMGHDGTRGARQIVERGGSIWAQDAQSSVVWGMPGSVVQSGLSEQVLSLEEVPRALAGSVQNTGSASLNLAAS